MGRRLWQKNNYLINQMKEIERIKAELQEAINTDTAHIYACFCLALYEHYNWGPDEIEELFCLTNQLWDENLERMDSMIEWCEQTTGIEIRSKE